MECSWITCCMQKRCITFCLAVLLGLLSILFSHAGVGVLQLGSASGPGQAPAGGNGDSAVPIVSPDGRFVLFSSTANNLTALGASNAPLTPSSPPRMNVFLRDRSTGAMTLVSVNTNGSGGGDGDSFPATVSTNGRYVLFESAASNLMPGDTNGATDIFVRDLVSGTTVLVSIATNGGYGNGASRAIWYRAPRLSPVLAQHRPPSTTQALARRL